jgi:hypothetical protein
MRAFAAYAGVETANISNLDPVTDAIEGNRAYVSITPEAGIVPTSPLAYLVRVNRPVFDKAVDIFGNRNEVIRGALQADGVDQRAKGILRGIGGFVGVNVHPAPQLPSGIAVPLISNVDTYGPWTYGTTPGKSNVIVDQTYVPWNFGGFDAMNAAAAAKVQDSISTMLVSESGDVEVVGIPTASLGDVLSLDGPNITNIDVNYGIGGVTTKYQFRIFTPTFGTLGKGMADRIRKNGWAIGQAKRAARASARERISTAEAARIAGGKGGGGIKPFGDGGPKAIDRKSPHDFMVATVVKETGTQGRFVTNVTTATSEEAMFLIQPDDPTGYKKSAAVSFDTLFVPYSTLPFSSGERDMPQYRNVAATGGITRKELDPWGLRPTNSSAFTRYTAYATGEGIAWQSYSNTNVSDAYEVRALALKTPLMLGGWGYDTSGNPVGGGNGAPSGWRVGPLDIRWDESKGLWSFPPVSTDTTTGNLGCASNCSWVAGLGTDECLSGTVTSASGKCETDTDTAWSSTFAHSTDRWIAEDYLMVSGEDYLVTFFRDHDPRGGDPVLTLTTTNGGTAGETVYYATFLPNCCGDGYASFAIGVVCSGTRSCPLDTPGSNVVIIRVEAVSCPNPNYHGEGWYCVSNACVFYSADPGDCVTIDGGPFDTEAECINVCVDDEPPTLPDCNTFPDLAPYVNGPFVFNLDGKDVEGFLTNVVNMDGGACCSALVTHRGGSSGVTSGISGNDNGEFSFSVGPCEGPLTISGTCDEGTGNYTVSSSCGAVTVVSVATDPFVLVMDWTNNGDATCPCSDVPENPTPRSLRLTIMQVLP